MQFEVLILNIYWDDKVIRATISPCMEINFYDWLNYKKFSLPPILVDKELVFLGFECFYKQLCLLKPRSADRETATKVNLSSLAYNYSKSKPEKSSLFDFSEIRKVMQELKNDNNLIITKPDKGNGCVLMNKSDYLGKMNDIISDSTKLKLLGKAT